MCSERAGAVRGRNRVPGPALWVSIGSDRFCGSRFRFRTLREKGFEGFSLMGSEGLGSVPDVLTEPFLGTGFQEPEVLRRFRAKVSDGSSVLRKCTVVL